MAQKKQQQVVMDATGRGDHDVNGRGTMLGTLDNSAANPMVNMKTLAPGSVSPGPGGEAAPQGAKKPMAEDVFQAIFAGEELTEEFRNKVSVLFETAVSQRVEEVRSQIIEESAAVVEQEIGTVVNELATKLDEYVTYVVEEWMGENKLQVESGIRTEIAESFMRGLRTLFETHYVEVPENKHDLLEDLFAENQKLEENLSKEIKNSVSLKKQIQESNAREIFLESTLDISRVDAERLASLANNINYNTLDEFKNKLTVLKENYLKAAPAPTKEPETLLESRAPVSSEGPMAAYLSAVTRQVKKV